MAKARLERSMTEGSPTKLILSFALPIVIGNLFQQFYTMVDTIIVGRYVGTEALAAVGSTGMITFLILGFFMGMTAGFSVPISQCYGAQDDVGVRKAVGSAALLSVFFTALITALSVGGMNWLLTLLNTPEEIFADAYTYIVLEIEPTGSRVELHIIYDNEGEEEDVKLGQINMGKNKLKAEFDGIRKIKAVYLSKSKAGTVKVIDFHYTD